MATLNVGTRLYNKFRVSSKKILTVSVRSSTFNKVISNNEKIMMADQFWNYKVEEISREIGLVIKENIDSKISNILNITAKENKQNSIETKIDNITIDLSNKNNFKADITSLQSGQTLLINNQDLIKNNTDLIPALI